jgi:DNA helicase-2/ATP-dependent DNA helicase PcrA
MGTGESEAPSPADASGHAHGGEGVSNRAENAPTGAGLLEGLTDPQRSAVVHTEGPLLILAAAGSGKTRVITRRIAYLVSMGVPAWSIRARTYKNKAAGEMRERVATILGGHDTRAGRGLTVTTFHALCARLLRKHGSSAGLRDNFTIYDTSDQSSLCKKVIESLQLSTSNFPVRSVLSAISTAKNQLLDADAFAAQAHDFSAKMVAKVYSGYTRALRAANAVDFDDLLLLTAKALRDDAQMRQACQDRWQYTMVDEYQDTNHAQFLIASMIAGGGGGGGGVGSSGGGGAAVSRTPNFCVVGDPDQSIYGWRGADIGNILEFEEHYPGCRVITLGENFRSTAPILAVADTLIRNNTLRKHKDLFTRRPGGEPVEATLCRDERHEAELVVDWLRRLHDGASSARPAKGEAPRPEAPRPETNGGVAWKDMAIFYRTNALSRVVEDACRGAGIPYTIARGTAFFEREEVRNALGYLRVVANPADGVSLTRIINTPTRGIGDATVEKIEAFAEREAMPMLEAVRECVRDPELSGRARNGCIRFIELVDAWTGGGTFMGEAITGSLADLVDRVVRESGLREMYVKQAATSKNEADEQRIDNLDELVSSARQFELEYDPASDAANQAPAEDPDPLGELVKTPPLLAMLRAYLESVTLVADADAVDPSQGSVTLMTLHAAKGLEFHGVAMIGMEEGMLPHMRAISGYQGSEREMEEERRLCFVGVTRAMRRLLMTAAKYRTVRGMVDRTIPSRFLSEMPKEHMVISDQSDAYADLAGSEWDAEDASDGNDQSPRTPERATPSAAMMSVPFPVGSSVRHPQFGVGIVRSVTPGSGARVEVEFKGVGRKTLVLEYARLTKIG